MTTDVETTTETDTETEATTTTIILTSDQAKMLAGLQHAATSDATRPLPLRGILLEWTATELTAVATDSYMMARRVFTLDQDGAHPEVEGSILVDAKPFAKALGEAAKAPNVFIEVVGDKLTINLGGGSVSVFAAIDATFPKWQHFYSDELLTEGEGKLPAINPKLLERVVKIAKGSPLVKSDIPMRLAWGETSVKGDLQPFRFELVDQSRGVLSIIVMPVKL